MHEKRWGENVNDNKEEDKLRVQECVCGRTDLNMEPYNVW